MATPPANQPPSLTAEEKGSFPHDSMVRRIREEIIARIFTENDFSEIADDVQRARVIANLKELDADMANAEQNPLRHIKDDKRYDVKRWNDLLDKHPGVTWTTAPWIISEFYVYRRVIEAIEYEDTRFDPFLRQKKSGLHNSVEMMERFAEKVLPLLQTSDTWRAASSTGPSEVAFKEAVTAFVEGSLWGNQADLSLWPVETASGNSTQPTTPTGSSSASGEGRAEKHLSDPSKVEKRLLSPQTEKIVKVLRARFETQDDRNVNIFTDNAGFEFFTDLCLADFLSNVLGPSAKIIFRLKDQPLYVSDVCPWDFQDTIAHLSSDSCAELPHLADLGRRWSAHVDAGRWIPKAEPFAVDPAPFWEMPSDLFEELSQTAQLVIVKGDANYRRLIGDLMWDVTTPSENVLGYFPTTLLALRTMKAPVGCGITAEDKEAAEREIPNWMCCGRCGLIQVARDNIV